VTRIKSWPALHAYDSTIVMRSGPPFF